MAKNDGQSKPYENTGGNIAAPGVAAPSALPSAPLKATRLTDDLRGKNAREKAAAGQFPPLENVLEILRYKDLVEGRLPTADDGHKDAPDFYHWEDLLRYVSQETGKNPRTLLDTTLAGFPHPEQIRWEAKLYKMRHNNDPGNSINLRSEAPLNMPWTVLLAVKDQIEAALERKTASPKKSPLPAAHETQDEAPRIAIAETSPDASPAAPEPANDTDDDADIGPNPFGGTNDDDGDEDDKNALLEDLRKERDPSAQTPDPRRGYEALMAAINGAGETRKKTAKKPDEEPPAPVSSRAGRGPRMDPELMPVQDIPGGKLRYFSAPMHTVAMDKSVQEAIRKYHMFAPAAPKQDVSSAMKNPPVAASNPVPRTTYTLPRAANTPASPPPKRYVIHIDYIAAALRDYVRQNKYPVPTGSHVELTVAVTGVPRTFSNQKLQDWLNKELVEGTKSVYSVSEFNERLGFLNKQYFTKYPVADGEKINAADVFSMIEAHRAKTGKLPLIEDVYDRETVIDGKIKAGKLAIMFQSGAIEGWEEFVESRGLGAGSRVPVCLYDFLVEAGLTKRNQHFEIEALRQKFNPTPALQPGSAGSSSKGAAAPKGSTSAQASPAASPQAPISRQRTYVLDLEPVLQGVREYVRIHKSPPVTSNAASVISLGSIGEATIDVLNRHLARGEIKDADRLHSIAQVASTIGFMNEYDSSFYRVAPDFKISATEAFERLQQYIATENALPSVEPTRKKSSPRKKPLGDGLNVGAFNVLLQRGDVSGWQEFCAERGIAPETPQPLCLNDFLVATGLAKRGPHLQILMANPPAQTPVQSTPSRAATVTPSAAAAWSSAVPASPVVVPGKDEKTVATLAMLADGVRDYVRTHRKVPAITALPERLLKITLSNGVEVTPVQMDNLLKGRRIAGSGDIIKLQNLKTRMGLVHAGVYQNSSPPPAERISARDAFRLVSGHIETHKKLPSLATYWSAHVIMPLLVKDSSNTDTGPGFKNVAVIPVARLAILFQTQAVEGWDDLVKDLKLASDTPVPICLYDFMVAAGFATRAENLVLTRAGALPSLPEDTPGFTYRSAEWMAKAVRNDVPADPVEPPQAQSQDASAQEPSASGGPS